jgi:hypothetical protein
MRQGPFSVALLTTTLVFGAACSFGHFAGGGSGGSPTSPSTGTSGPPPTYSDEAGRGFTGVHPAPIIVGGITYLYVNTGTAGTTVQASMDGLSFTPTPATYPAGASRTIVSLPDGRYRMYYYSPDGTSTDVLSAVSNNGLNWTVEPGVRYSDPAAGAIRATALPTGGYRLYYPSGTGFTSALSTDGLSFTSEGPIAITQNDATFTWGASAAAYVNGQFHMVLTRIPTSTNVSELWHAVSLDGRTWTVDRSAMAANPGVPINQPAWAINGSTDRIYYRAQPNGSNAIASGVIRF